jgi:hypothetical protein
MANSRSCSSNVNARPTGGFRLRNAQTIEIYRLANSPHADTLTMVYLPKEQILIQADAYTPAPPVISPATLNLYENMRRLKLDVTKLAALHGPGLATMTDLMKAAARDKTN